MLESWPVFLFFSKSNPKFGWGVLIREGVNFISVVVYGDLVREAHYTISCNSVHFVPTSGDIIMQTLEILSTVPLSPYPSSAVKRDHSDRCVQFQCLNNVIINTTTEIK